MNQLKIYLAGPMEHCANHGRDWRNKIKLQLQDLNYEVLDPGDYEDPSIPQELKELKEAGYYDDVAAHSWIRKRDMELVREADLLLAYLDLDIITCGTWEEIFYANSLNKTVIIFVKQGKQYCPCWLFWTIPHSNIHDNWTTIKQYITQQQLNRNACEANSHTV